MKKLIPFFGFALFFASLAFAANYYVTQSGSGSSNGTYGNPWSLAQWNTQSLTGPNHVYFSGVFSGTQIVNVASGSGTGSGNVILDFSAATVNGPGGGTAYIYNNGQSHVTYYGGGSFSGSTWTPGMTFGANSTNASMGNPASSAPSSGNGGPDIFSMGNTGSQYGTDVTITGFTYNGGNWDAVLFVENHAVSNLTITGNYANNVNGLYYGDTIYQNGLKIINNFARSSLNTYAQLDMVKPGDANNVTIEGNVLINQAPNNGIYPANNPDHNDVIQTFEKNGNAQGTPYGWVIAYNWIENNDQPTSDGNGTWMIFENMTNNGSTPALLCYSNVFISPSNTNDQSNGIVMDGNTGATFYFYNNTLISLGGQPNGNFWNLSSNYSTCTIIAENNVAEAANGYGQPLIAGGSGTYWNIIGWNHNFFANLGTSLSAYTGAAGYNAGNGVSSDPWFVNFTGTPGAQLPSAYNYATVSGSHTLQNAGDSTIGATFNQGIAVGATWPNPALATRSTGNWDVGAYQYEPTPTPTPTPTPGLTGVQSSFFPGTAIAVPNL